MLFEFIGHCQAMGEGEGWGRGMRRAIAEIYLSKEPRSLAYWVSKDRQRVGWTHRDVLRVAHVKPGTDGHNLVLNYAAKDALAALAPGAEKSNEAAAARAFLTGVEAARRSEDAQEVIRPIASCGLAREHVPSPLLGSVEVWRALLDRMPMTAMMRNLAKMTAVGLLKPLSAEVARPAPLLPGWRSFAHRNAAARFDSPTPTTGVGAPNHLAAAGHRRPPPTPPLLHASPGRLFGMPWRPLACSLVPDSLLVH